MNRKAEFISRIWLEKREKIVSDKICELGVSIALDGLDFDWHVIIYELLALLRSDIDKAYHWSQHWGRTMVQVHPHKTFSFKFTLLDGFEEKSGVFLFTTKRIDPIHFLNHQNNIGAFEILLNKQDLALEGAILQVERMIDELVWCRYLFLKGQERTRGRSMEDRDIYGMALEDVWRQGVRIRYVSESVLLDMKQLNPELPVRIYGNIRKRGTVPLVIGAVGLFSEMCKVDEKEISRVREGVFKHFFTLSRKFDPQPLIDDRLADYRVDDRFSVCTAITTAKKIHVGHLLLISYAHLVSVVLNGDQWSIWIECNDVGDRILGTIATLSIKFGVSVSEVIVLLSEGRIPVDEIDACYKRRVMFGDVYDEALSVFSETQTELLWLMREYIEFWLGKFGFGRVKTISDSACFPEYRESIQALNESNLSELGFSFVRYQHRGDKKMCVLERQSTPTASSMRSAFVFKLIKTVTEGRVIPVFVDAGADILAAKDLVRLAGGVELERIEGAGLGYGMNIMSGSGDETLLIEDLFRFISENSRLGDDPEVLRQVMTFFVLTRFMTAKAYKKDTAVRGHKIGLSFYDYANEESFKGDLMRCFEGLANFRQMIDELCAKIKGSIDAFEEDVLEFSESSYKQKELDGFFMHLEHLSDLVDIGILLPRARAVGLDKSFCDMRRLIMAACEVDIAIADEYLLKALLQGMDTFEGVSRYLSRNGLCLINVPSDWCTRKVECFFVENLLERGYSSAQLEEFASAYIKGEYILLKKRCAFFEDLQKANKMTRLIKRIGFKKADTLLEALSFCMKRLGFEDVN